METVRGDAGPQVRPFQTVDNYQGNWRKRIAYARKWGYHIWQLSSIFLKADCQVFQQTAVDHIKARQTQLEPNKISTTGVVQDVSARLAQTRQGHVSRHSVSANLASLSSSESYGRSLASHLLSGTDQHGYRPRHSQALLQLTTDVATGFKQIKSPNQTICVAIDLTAAFNIVVQNVLLSDIVRSTVPLATCRWQHQHNSDTARPAWSIKVHHRLS